MARMSTIVNVLTWLFAFSATSMADAGYSGPGYPYHPHDSPLGVHLGTDYITVTASAEGSKTYMVLQQEGDIRYKSLMRQKIMSHHIIRDLYENTDAKEQDSSDYLSSELRADVIDYLPVLYGDPATATELKSLCARLKEDVGFTLGRKFREVVLAVPAHISEATRKMLRRQLDNVGFYVIGATRTNGLVAAQLGYDSEAESPNLHFMLFVEIGGAALEISLLAIQHSAVDVLAYEARSELSEDVASLQVIQSLAHEHRLKNLDPGPIMAFKSRLQRSWNDAEGEFAAPTLEEFTFDPSFNHSRIDFANLKNISTLNQEQRSKDIRRTLETFLSENVWEDELEEDDSEDRSTLNPNWKPYRSQIDEILIAGDESERDAQILRRAISESPGLSRMKMLSSRDEVPRGQTGAHVAAWNGQSRVDVEEPGGKATYLVHGEL